MLSKRAIYSYMLILMVMAVIAVCANAFGVSPKMIVPTLTPPPANDNFGQEYYAIKNSLKVVTCKNVLLKSTAVGITDKFPKKTSTVHLLITFKGQGTHFFKTYWYKDNELVAVPIILGKEVVRISIGSKKKPISAGRYRVVVVYSKAKEDKGYVLKEVNFTVGK